MPGSRCHETRSSPPENFRKKVAKENVLNLNARRVFFGGGRDGGYKLWLDYGFWSKAIKFLVS